MGAKKWVGLAAIDAARDAGNRWIFPELLKEGLEPWGNVQMVCVNGSPTPTHAVDVTLYIEKGIASLEKHRVYIDNLPGSFNPNEFIRQITESTGKLLGCKYAVSFEVIRI